MTPQSGYHLVRKVDMAALCKGDTVTRDASIYTDPMTSSKVEAETDAPVMLSWLEDFFGVLVAPTKCEVTK